jgi:hypothetical protein
MKIPIRVLIGFDALGWIAIKPGGDMEVGRYDERLLVDMVMCESGLDGVPPANPVGFSSGSMTYCITS